MYKTIWSIKTDNNKIKLTFYHFNKIPKFPTWYMEENKTYEIEMLWNFKLANSLKMFFRCLTHFYIIK